MPWRGWSELSSRATKDLGIIPHGRGPSLRWDDRLYVRFIPRFRSVRDLEADRRAAWLRRELKLRSSIVRLPIVARLTAPGDFTSDGVPENAAEDRVGSP